LPLAPRVGQGLRDVGEHQEDDVDVSRGTFLIGLEWIIVAIASYHRTPAKERNSTNLRCHGKTRAESFQPV
jgi:hypothetical protein